MFTRFVVAGSLFGLSGIAVAAPSGHIAGISNGAASIVNAATGRIQTLPHGQRAWKIAISPQGSIAYFVTPAGKPLNTGEEAKTPTTGYISTKLSRNALLRMRAFPGMTYRTTNLLPAVLQQTIPYQLDWSPSGTSLWFSNAQGQNKVYTPDTHNVSTIPRRPDDVSRDGRTIAFSNQTSISVRDARGRERVIFSINKPQALFNALKTARKPAGVRDLVGGIDPELWKQSRNWTLSEAALAPDGSRLYFAANGGTSMGAAGNTTYCIFSYDLKTNKLAVLSTVGALFGRSPDTFEVSPDGKRLLVASSVHSSAAENPYFVLVIDLLTQKSRELLTTLPEAKNDSNLMDSVAWSPDGRYVAISAYFYNVEAITRNGFQWTEPKDKDWRVFIQDATTGKTVRRLRGIRELSWGQ